MNTPGQERRGDEAAVVSQGITVESYAEAFQELPGATAKFDLLVLNTGEIPSRWGVTQSRGKRLRVSGRQVWVIRNRVHGAEIRFDAMW